MNHIADIRLLLYSLRPHQQSTFTS